MKVDRAQGEREFFPDPRVRSYDKWTVRETTANLSTSWFVSIVFTSSFRSKSIELHNFERPPSQNYSGSERETRKTTNRSYPGILFTKQRAGINSVIKGIQLMGALES